jgi:hypothetical protein
VAARFAPQRVPWLADDADAGMRAFRSTPLRYARH